MPYVCVSPSNNTLGKNTQSSLYCNLSNDATHSYITNGFKYKVQVLQNSCLRVCIKADKRTSIAELHSVAGVPKLETRRMVHTCNFVKKGAQGQLSAGIKQMFTYVAESSSVATRANVDSCLKVPRRKLRLSEGNIAIRGARYLNNLPTELRIEQDSDKFKNKVKAYYYGL